MQKRMKAISKERYQNLIQKRESLKRRHKAAGARMSAASKIRDLAESERGLAEAERNDLYYSLCHVEGAIALAEGKSF
jgi:hypothetical protein